MTSSFVLSLSIFCVGPSSLLDLGSSSLLIAVGLFASGLARALIQSFAASEAIAGGVKHFPQYESEIIDSVSSFYISLYGLTGFLYPIASSCLTQHIGYAYTMDVVGLVVLTSSIVYCVSTIVDLRRETKKNLKISAVE